MSIVLTVREIRNLYQATLKAEVQNHITYLIQKEPGIYVTAIKYTPLSGYLKEDGVDITDYFK